MGRFLIGLGVGMLLGALAVILASPRRNAGGAGGLVRGAIEAGRHTAEQHERELRGDFRKRITPAKREPSS